MDVRHLVQRRPELIPKIHCLLLVESANVLRELQKLLQAKREVGDGFGVRGC